MWAKLGVPFFRPDQPIAAAPEGTFNHGPLLTLYAKHYSRDPPTRPGPRDATRSLKPFALLSRACPFHTLVEPQPSSQPPTHPLLIVRRGRPSTPPSPHYGRGIRNPSRRNVKRQESWRRLRPVGNRSAPRPHTSRKSARLNRTTLGPRLAASWAIEYASGSDYVARQCTAWTVRPGLRVPWLTLLKRTPGPMEPSSHTIQSDLFNAPPSDLRSQ